jgi:hypothetical protein
VRALRRSPLHAPPNPIQELQSPYHCGWSRPAQQRLPSNHALSQYAQVGKVELISLDDRTIHIKKRNWPPAFKEWNTRSVRDAFFASPQFPRLLNPDSIKDTIARGVENGMLGYIGKKADGSYAPFHWNSSLPPRTSKSPTMSSA